MAFQPGDLYGQQSQGQYGQQEQAGAYAAKTFLWMFLGLLVTFGVAVASYTANVFMFFYTMPGGYVILTVAELAVVLILSARLQKLSVGGAMALFFVYAVLNGVVFSTLFWAFDVATLILVFGVTALYFGGLALYGYFTKADLSRLRPILVGGLIFLLVAGILSLFLPLGSFERIYCLIGIAVFLGFTAYDTQKIRTLYAAFSYDQALLQKASIYAALQLYLDFVNLFLYLLRFLGKRK